MRHAPFLFCALVVAACAPCLAETLPSALGRVAANTFARLHTRRGGNGVRVAPAFVRAATGRQQRWITQPANCVPCAMRGNESFCLAACSCGWCHAAGAGLGTPSGLAGVVLGTCLDVSPLFTAGANATLYVPSGDSAAGRPDACPGASAWHTDADTNDCKFFPLATMQGLAATLAFALAFVAGYLLLKLVCCCCCGGCRGDVASTVRVVHQWVGNSSSGAPHDHRGRGAARRSDKRS